MKVLNSRARWWKYAFQWGRLIAQQFSPQRVAFTWDSKSILDVEFISEGCYLDHKTKQAIMAGIKDILLKELDKQNNDA